MDLHVHRDSPILPIIRTLPCNSPIPQLHKVIFTCSIQPYFGLLLTHLPLTYFGHKHPFSHSVHIHSLHVSEPSQHSLIHSFHILSTLLTFCIFVLFHYFCSHAHVLGTTLVYVFHIYCIMLNGTCFFAKRDVWSKISQSKPTYNENNSEHASIFGVAIVLLIMKSLFYAPQMPRLWLPRGEAVPRKVCATRISCSAACCS